VGSAGRVGGCTITSHQAIISSSQNVRMMTIVPAETARTNSKLTHDLALGQGIPKWGLARCKPLFERWDGQS
jgi:hypothetical protein